VTGFHLDPLHRAHYDGCTVVDALGLRAPEFEECCECHDELYLQKAEGQLGVETDRAIADLLFLHCMMRKAREAPTPERRRLLEGKARTRFWAVTAFGGIAWYT